MRADPTVPKRFRNPDDAVGAEGRAFQVDATCADVAILREPLVPCVAITSPQDCIFGQSQPFLTSVLGAAAAAGGGAIGLTGGGGPAFSPVNASIAAPIATIIDIVFQHVVSTLPPGLSTRQHS